MLWGICKHIFEVGYVLVETTGESAGDARVGLELKDFLSPQDEDGSNITWDAWLSLSLVFLATLPMTITMIYSSRKKSVQPVLPEASENQNDYQALEQPSSHHHPLHVVKDFCIIGVPFALLVYGGSVDFLSGLTDSNAVSIPIGALLALASAWGNYQLHGEHQHAEKGVLALLREIPSRERRIWLGLYASSVIAGHFCEGFLNGNIFLKSINTNNPYIEVFVSLALGVAITYFEGITEMRSALLLEMDDQRKQRIHGVTKVVMIPASAIHGLMPTMGLLSLIDDLHALFTSVKLRNQIGLESRAIMVAFSAISLGYYNAKGFYCTTVTETDEALRSMGNALTACHQSLFVCEKKRAANMGTPDTIIEPQAVATPSAAV